jgi:hypothetical protein
MVMPLSTRAGKYRNGNHDLDLDQMPHFRNHRNRDIAHPGFDFSTG